LFNCVGSKFFDSGHTTACLKRCGYWPLSSDLLNSRVMNGTSRSLNSFTIHVRHRFELTGIVRHLTDKFDDFITLNFNPRFKKFSCNASSRCRWHRHSGSSNIIYFLIKNLANSSAVSVLLVVFLCVSAYVRSSGRYATVSLRRPCCQRSAPASDVDIFVHRADAWPWPAVSMLADLCLPEFYGIFSPAPWITFGWIDTWRQTTGSVVHTCDNIW